MFSVNTDDLQFLFESARQPVFINDIERQAIITNPQMSANEERYIHTIERVLQGDIVALDNEKFLIISESVTKRHSKYKAKIKHCNYIIEIAGEITEVPMLDENGNPVYDRYGDPVMIQIQGESSYIPAIVENKTFSIVGNQLLVEENQIIVIVQDNELNKEKFKLNNKINLMESNWTVRNIDKTKKGLLILTCESGI